MAIKVLSRRETEAAQEVFVEGGKEGGVLNRTLNKGLREVRQGWGICAEGEVTKHRGSLGSAQRLASRRGREWDGPSRMELAGWSGL